MREAKEETSLDVRLVEQFYAYSDPARDPRHHTVSTVFIATAEGTPRGADDAKIAQLFRDCARGAVPAVGECYGLEVIVDDSLDMLPDVYIEGGDHATLIHVDRGQFARLNMEAQHGRFSAHN